MVKMTDTQQPSYGQILKSTSLTGGSQVIGVAANIIRLKLFALWLGPAGIGLLGMYTAVMGVAGTIAGMGIRSSGVRQIAQAEASGDKKKVARITITIRRVSVGLGLCGTLLLIVFSRSISTLTFNTPEYAQALSLLAVTIFFHLVDGGQTAPIQGMRRIADLAKITVINAVVGSLLSLVIIYLFRDQGIELFLIVLSLVSLLTSWLYVRNIKIKKTIVTWKDSWVETRTLFSLGIVFMGTGLLSTGTPYLIRIVLSQKFGMAEIGMYQASMSLAWVYIGIILNAMGADFYPRLTAASDDNDLCNRLVNEQTEVGVLIAAPGVLITIALAPFVIQLFYSAEFLPAYEILRWQILGVMLRVVSWPLAFILLVKGKGKVYFLTELLAHCSHLLLFWFGVLLFGLTGAGMAYFGVYIFYIMIMAVVTFRISGFYWSAATLKVGAIAGALTTTVFMSHYLFPPLWAALIGVLATMCMGIYSSRFFFRLIGVDKFMDLWIKIRDVFHRSSI